VKWKRKKGLPPGTVTYTGDKADMPISITYIQYTKEDFLKQSFVSSTQVELHASNEKEVQWYDIRGLHQPTLIQQVGGIFNMHPLAMEDAVDVHKRPECVFYQDSVFFALKAVALEDMSLNFQNISLYFGKGFLLTFQEHEDDVFELVINRIEHSLGRIRNKGADYLTYALMDLIVDGYFHTVDQIEKKVFSLEEALNEDVMSFDKDQLYRLKKVILEFKRVILPLREALSQLFKGEPDTVDQSNLVFFNDLYDNLNQVLDGLDSTRDSLIGLQELFHAEMSARTNDVMRFLAVVTTLFVPISFVAGLYGVNFTNLPGSHSPSGFWWLIGVMGVITIGLLYFFKRNKWI
jgi:magnesium transporter